MQQLVKHLISFLDVHGLKNCCLSSRELAETILGHKTLLGRHAFYQVFYMYPIFEDVLKLTWTRYDLAMFLMGYHNRYNNGLPEERIPILDESMFTPEFMMHTMTDNNILRFKMLLETNKMTGKALAKCLAYALVTNRVWFAQKIWSLLESIQTRLDARIIFDIMEIIETEKFEVFDRASTDTPYFPDLKCPCQYEETARRLWMNLFGLIEELNIEETHRFWKGKKKMEAYRLPYPKPFHLINLLVLKKMNVDYENVDVIAQPWVILIAIAKGEVDVVRKFLQEIPKHFQGEPIILIQCPEIAVIAGEKEILKMILDLTDPNIRTPYCNMFGNRRYIYANESCLSILLAAYMEDIDIADQDKKELLTNFFECIIVPEQKTFLQTTIKYQYSIIQNKPIRVLCPYHGLSTIHEILEIFRSNPPRLFTFYSWSDMTALAKYCRKVRKEDPEWKSAQDILATFTDYCAFSTEETMDSRLKSTDFIVFASLIDPRKTVLWLLKKVEKDQVLFWSFPKDPFEETFDETFPVNLDSVAMEELFMNVLAAEDREISRNLLHASQIAIERLKIKNNAEILCTLPVLYRSHLDELLFLVESKHVYRLVMHWFKCKANIIPDAMIEETEPVTYEASIAFFLHAYDRLHNQFEMSPKRKTTKSWKDILFKFVGDWKVDDMCKLLDLAITKGQIVENYKIY